MTTKENCKAPLAEDPEFNASQLKAVDEIIRRNRAKPGSLIPVLEDVQDLLGYLPKSIQIKVSRGLGIALSEVHGVVTFYSFFTMVPKGRHTTRCCLGTACYVRGGRKNLEKLVGTLKVSPGNTTGDRRFSLETVRCLGACGLAPVITVDDDTYRQVKAVKIPEILDGYQ